MDQAIVADMVKLAVREGTMKTITLVSCDQGYAKSLAYCRSRCCFIISISRWAFHYRSHLSTLQTDRIVPAGIHACSGFLACTEPLLALGSTVNDRGDVGGFRGTVIDSAGSCMACSLIQMLIKEHSRRILTHRPITPRGLLGRESGHLRKRWSLQPLICASDLAFSWDDVTGSDADAVDIT